MKKLPFDISVTIATVVIIFLAGGAGYYWLDTQLDSQLDELQAVIQKLDAQAENKIAPTEQNKAKAIQKSKLAQDILSRIYPFLSESDPLFDEWRKVRGTKTTPSKGRTPTEWQRRFNFIRQNILHPLAEQNKVRLPKPFYYSFDEFTRVLPPEDKTFDLGIELEEIKELSTVLFKQKIYELTSIRRVLVESKDSSEGGGNGLDARILNGPDDIYQAYPCELQFRCTPSELIGVVNAISSDQMLFIIRFITVKNDKLTVPTETDLETTLASAPEGATKKIFIVVAGEEYINVTMWVDLLLWNGPAPSKITTTNDTPAPATP